MGKSNIEERKLNLRKINRNLLSLKRSMFLAGISTMFLIFAIWNLIFSKLTQQELLTYFLLIIVGGISLVILSILQCDAETVIDGELTNENN